MSDVMDMKSVINDALGAIDALRSNGAQVHSITNTVVQNFTANVLLACGARPSMTVNPAEIADFTNRADTLHVNLGTLNDQRMEAIRIAASIAGKNEKPFILDPVMVHVSSLRLDFARELLGLNPNIVKANAVEMQVLGLADTICRVTTGAKDHITQSGISVTVQNGDPLLDKVIGSGCALGALIAALAVHAKSPLQAAVAGTLWFSVAGEIAAGKSAGPGSFVPQLLDSLHGLEINQIEERMKLS